MMFDGNVNFMIIVHNNKNFNKYCIPVCSPFSTTEKLANKEAIASSISMLSGTNTFKAESKIH